MKSNNNSASKEIPKPPDSKFRDIPPGPSGHSFARQSPSNFQFISNSPYRANNFVHEASPSFHKRSIQMNNSSLYIPITQRPSPSQNLYQRRLENEFQNQQQQLQQQQQQQQQQITSQQNSSAKKPPTEFRQSLNYQDLKTQLREEIREFKEREEQNLLSNNQSSSGSQNQSLNLQQLNQQQQQQQQFSNTNPLNQTINLSSNNIIYDDPNGNSYQQNNNFNNSISKQRSYDEEYGNNNGRSGTINLYHVEQSPGAVLQNSMLINQYPASRSKEGTPNRSHYLAEQTNIRYDLSSKLQRVSEVAETASEDIKKLRDEARALRYELALISKAKQDVESQYEQMQNHYTRQLALEQGESKRAQQQLSWHIVREKDLENQLKQIERQSEFQLQREQNKTQQLKKQLETKLEKQTSIMESDAIKLQEDNAILRREAAWFSVNQQSLENKINLLQQINNDLKIKWDGDIQRFGLETESLQNQLSIEQRKNQELQHVRRLTDLRSLASKSNESDIFKRYQEQIDHLNNQLELLSRQNFELETQNKQLKRNEIESVAAAIAATQNNNNNTPLGRFGANDISNVQVLDSSSGNVNNIGLSAPQSSNSSPLLNHQYQLHQQNQNLQQLNVEDLSMNIDLLKQSTLFQQEIEGLRAQLRLRDSQVNDLNFLLAQMKEDYSRLTQLKDDEIFLLNDELNNQDKLLSLMQQQQQQQQIQQQFQNSQNTITNLMIHSSSPGGHHHSMTGSGLYQTNQTLQQQQVLIEKYQRQGQQYLDIIQSQEKQLNRKEMQIKLLDQQLLRSQQRVEELESTRGVIGATSLSESILRNSGGPGINLLQVPTGTNSFKQSNASLQQEVAQQKESDLNSDNIQDSNVVQNKSSPNQDISLTEEQVNELENDMEYIKGEWTATLDGNQIANILDNSGWNLRSLVNLGVFNNISCFVGIMELSKHEHEHSLAKALIHRIFKKVIVDPETPTSLNLDVEQMDDQLIAFLENNCNFKEDDPQTLDDFFNEFLCRICRVLVVSMNLNDDMSESYDSIKQFAIKYGIVSNIVVLQHSEDAQKIIDEQDLENLQIFTIRSSSFDATDLEQIIQIVRKRLLRQQQEAYSENSQIIEKIQLLPNLAGFLRQKVSEIYKITNEPIQSGDENSYNIRFDCSQEPNQI